jgi:hypothetical protein
MRFNKQFIEFKPVRKQETDKCFLLHNISYKPVEL